MLWLFKSKLETTLLSSLTPGPVNSNAIANFCRMNGKFACAWPARCACYEICQFNVNSLCIIYRMKQRVGINHPAFF
jgi:hypothetical protein